MQRHLGFEQSSVDPSQASKFCDAASGTEAGFAALARALAEAERTLARGLGALCFSCDSPTLGPQMVARRQRSVVFLV